MEILEFIFKSFWHFAGCFVLICVICNAVSSMFIRNNIVVNSDKKEDENDA